MKYHAVNISLICLALICLVMLFKTLHEKEGFDHKYKNSWSLSNQITYIRNKYNQNKKMTETKIRKTFIEPVNKKINYYINKYL